MSTSKRLYAYRPGVDGIRGIGMTLFLLWHVGVLTQLPGLWVYMNAFFILSAFLITRLLIAEAKMYGHISIKGFYLRRVRRLLPALLITLSAVTIDGLFFAPSEEKINLKGDIFATLAYVMNWRLILRDDQYVTDFTHPSILRHAWSLSVEEQFYVVVPVIVLCVLLYLRSRLSRTAVFVALAAASAVWARTLNLTTLRGQAHAYYGTDIRLMALGLGVAAGVWTAHAGRGRTLLRPDDPRDVLDRDSRVLEVLGWVGAFGMVLIFIWVGPYSAWLYSDGGYLLLTLAPLFYVVACAQRGESLLVRLHSSRPAVEVGRRSYGVYLYHWPIFLWLRRAWPSANLWVMALATLTLALAAAWVSYRYVEQPVIKRGLKAFGGVKTRAKTAMAAGLAFVIGGALCVTAGGTATANKPIEYPQYVAHIPQLVDGQPPYVAPKQLQKVAFYGDSMPYFLVQRMPTKNFSNFDAISMGTPGCDLLDAPIQWTADQQQANDDPCKLGKENFVSNLKQSKADTLVIMTTAFLALRHDVDGKVLWLHDPAYVNLITSTLTRLTDQARKAGVKHVLITTVPCRRITELEVPVQYREDFDKYPYLVKEGEDPVQVNAILTKWAATQNVPVIDLGKAVCGSSYSPTRHGIKLYDDGIHFSPQATPMVWGWLAPQVLKKSGAQ